MKLFYFAGRGRGEQVRLLLADLKQPYEDVRLDGAALGALKVSADDKEKNSATYLHLVCRKV